MTSKSIFLRSSVDKDEASRDGGSQRDISIFFFIYKFSYSFLYVLFSQTQYLVERHGDTLLPQYLGMYRLTVEGVETYMLVMRSVFSCTLPVHRKYDLKGSTIDRQATDKEKVGTCSVSKFTSFV